MTRLPVRQTQAWSLARGERCFLDKLKIERPRERLRGRPPRVKARLRKPLCPNTAERTISSGSRGLIRRVLSFLWFVRQPPGPALPAGGPGQQFWHEEALAYRAGAGGTANQAPLNFIIELVAGTSFQSALGDPTPFVVSLSNRPRRTLRHAQGERPDKSGLTAISKTKH